VATRGPCGAARRSPSSTLVFWSCLKSDTTPLLALTARRAIIRWTPHFVAENIARPSDPATGPIRFGVEGRTADGRVSISGAAYLFAPASPAEDPGAAAIPLSSSHPSWLPSFEVRIELENVGLATVGRMAHTLTLVPTSGSVTGTVQLALRDRRIDCTTDLVLHDVAYDLNDRAGGPQRDRSAVRLALRDYRANGRVLAECGGSLDNDGYRTIPAAQAAMTSEAVRGAPATVRELALEDQRSFGARVVEAGLAGAASAVTRELQEAATGALGKDVGGAVASSLADGSAPEASQEKSGNPVVSGVKRIGSGIKGLFSRKKKQ
jgi:hypothetical protein